MSDAPLDRLNALTIVFDAMTDLRNEATINQFDELEYEIHKAVAELKKAGMWMRQITPLIAPSVRVLERVAAFAQQLEKQSISTQPHGFRRLSKSSAALVMMVEAYESGETILFSDEMNLSSKKEESTASPK